MRPEVELTVLKEWPSAMPAKLAAQYLGVKPDYFRRLVDNYPAILRPFNYQPGADKFWSRRALDEFREYRERAGVETKAG